MGFRELLPFLLPSISLQFFVQAYYIRDCIRHPSLSKWNKLKYALGIAAFSLPMAAYYLLKERNEDNNEDISQGIFKSNVRQAIFVLIVIAFEILSIRVIVSHVGTPDFQPLVWISAISIVVMILTELCIQWKKQTVAYIFSFLLCLLGFSLQYLVVDMNTPFLIIILSASIINNYPLRHTKKFVFFVIFGFVLMGILRPMLVDNIFDVDEIFSSVYLNSVILILVVLSFYILKQQYLTNHQLSRTLKTVENQNIMIEELSKTEERNRIAREIHDTVGHRLTGALYMIEVAAMSKEKQVIKEKLDTAHTLIKDSLSDIRHSVRLLVDEPGVFSEKAVSLKEEMIRNTNMDIEMIVTVSEQIPGIHQRLILRAMMECVTNTVKHSQGKKADILIQESKNRLHYSYSDNGENVKAFTMGFGLTSMKESVESLGGIFSADSTKEGFTVSFSLPLGRNREVSDHE